MKNILFLALGYPNADKTTNIYTDLIKEFHSQGHPVMVLAPALKKNDEGLRLEAGIQVLRVPTLKLFKTNIIQKGLANILLPYQYKKALKKNNIALNFDLILITTPPITLSNLAGWIKKKTEAKVYLILRDIFPQNAVDLKIIRPSGLVHSFFRKKELELYNIADNIGCMSPANINYIKKHNPKLDSHKLHLLPNWENLPDPITKQSSESIKEKYGLKNKFVVIFGGNLGKPQKMENIIRLAEKCTEIDDLVFFIIGDGTEKEKLMQLLAELKLPNVILENKIPRKEYNELLNAADIGLISLNEDFTIPNFPSKLLSYMGSKKAVLASIDLQTDFGLILEEINAGVWAEAGNTEQLKEKLLLLYNSSSLREQMGNNGYNHMISNLLPKHAYSKIMENLD
jgi:glycosyltransferase involved in cell wall biosynthesis